MIARTLAAVATAAVVALLAPTAAALDPPHNGTHNITCVDCHALIPGGPDLELRGTRQETVCLSCHNPTGQAASMSEVAIHVVGDGVEIDCGSCHDPHGPHVTSDADHGGGVEAPNLSLIRSDTATYWPAALEPAVFQKRPEDFAFATAPYNGVCQTCHVSTKYHNNSGVGADQTHQLGNDCVSCHAHRDGFRPTGCIACHATVQDNGDGIPVGGRPPVTDLFSPASPGHGHLAGGAVEDADCVVCHSTASHMDGYIDLINQDTGEIISFSSLSDVVPGDDVSDFCLSCHDSDGAALAASPMDPFGSGNPPPEVASRFQGTLQWNEWYGDMCFGSEGTMRGVNSHHDISDADQAFSGARLECTSCHNSHAAQPGQALADPWDTRQPWTGTNTEFCLSCHGGGGGPTDSGMPPTVTPPAVWVDDNGAVCGNPNGDTCDVHSTQVSGLRPMESCDYAQGPWYMDYIFTRTAHGGDSKRGWGGYSGAPEANLECMTCHDPHGSWSETNPAGNPYMIRDFVDGSPFVDDGVRPGAQWTGPPWDTMGVARSVVVAVDTTNDVVDWGGSTGLCATCHADWLSAYDFHSFCTACQTCHNHGATWGNHDWGGNPMEDTGCYMCGNGAVEGLEECDDNNQLDGDGCSSECKLEP